MTPSRFLRISLLSLSIVLTACGVDTTGISPNSSRIPKGSPSAAVLITEYADLQCPACKQAHELITKPLLLKHGQSIRFEYKHFPLRSIHAHALPAAEAAECAADQGKFWEFIDLAYEHQSDLGSKPYKEWATNLQLNMDLFGRCVDSNIKRATVLSDYEAGAKLGVNSTPTYFVNGKKVEHSLENLDAAIKSAQSQTESAPL